MNSFSYVRAGDLEGARSKFAFQRVEVGGAVSEHERRTTGTNAGQ